MIPESLTKGQGATPSRTHPHPRMCDSSRIENRYELWLRTSMCKTKFPVLGRSLCELFQFVTLWSELTVGQLIRMGRSLADRSS